MHFRGAMRDAAGEHGEAGDRWMWGRMCWREPDLSAYWTVPERCMAGELAGRIRSAMGLPGRELFRSWGISAGQEKWKAYCLQTSCTTNG